MGSRRFVGRQRELAVLRGAEQRARDARPQVVVIGGESGMGKTRMIDRFTTALDSDVRILRGTCMELGTEGLPLTPVIAVLRDLIADGGPAAVTSLLPGAEALLGLLPELDLPGPVNQAAVFDLFCALLQRLGSEQPVVLIVDDLHWADRSTRDLLGVLARTLRGAKVLVITAHRSDLPRSHPLRPFLAELARLPVVHRVALPPFSRAEITELIADVAGPLPGPVVELIQRRSAGNAFFAEELAQAGDPTGLPESLGDLLRHRIAGLPDDCRRVVRVAAVGGPAVPHELLAATAGLDEDRLIEAARLASDAGVLLPGPDGYAFRHALLREAVVDDLLPAEQVRLHTAFARTLEAAPQLVPPDRLAAQVAFHWYGAGQDARALPALVRAAGTAERLYAHAERLQMLERVLELWPRVPDPAHVAGTDRLGVFEAAIATATWAGEDVHGLELIDRALAEADPGREPARTALLLAHRGMMLANLGRDSALTVVDEALELLPTAPTTSRAQVLDLAGAVLAVKGRPERARRVAHEAAALAAELGESRMEINARTTLGWALNQLGLHSDGIAVLRSARDLAAGHDDEVGVVRADLNLAEAFGHLGRSDAVIDAARHGLDAARAAGLRPTLGALLAGQLAGALAATGRWDEADRTCVESIRLDPPGTIGASLHALRAEVALARGDVAVARTELSLMRTSLTGTGGTALATVRLDIELALIDGAAHGLDRAVLESVLPTVGELGADSPPPDAWPLLSAVARLARHLAGNARPGGDESLVTAVRAAASRLARDTPLWSAYASQVDAETGGLTSWQDVVSAWDGIGHPYAAARARLRAAESALGVGDTAAARQLLREARDPAARLGASPLLDDVTALARGARVALDDERAPGPRQADRFGLTVRETDVLRLIMTGRSNRQIGEQLFISPKTVSVHVSSILAKLGVSSRGEAVATAHRLHLFTARA